MQRTQERKEFHFFVVHQSTQPISIIVVVVIVKQTRKHIFLAGLLHFTDRELPGSCLTLHSMGNLKRNEGDSKQMHNLRLAHNGEWRDARDYPQNFDISANLESV